MDLYCFPRSPPCKAVHLTAIALGIKFNEKHLNLMKFEQLDPSFVKVNPEHTVPTLIDDGFILSESRAIIIYLVEKYGKENHPLYPKDPKVRATINQRLYFDAGTLYLKFAEYFYPMFFFKQSADPAKYRLMKIAVGFLETYLEGHDYAVGDSLTLADFSLVATIATYDKSGFEFKDFPNISRWYERCKTNIQGFREIFT